MLSLFKYQHEKKNNNKLSMKYQSHPNSTRNMPCHNPSYEAKKNKILFKMKSNIAILFHFNLTIAKYYSKITSHSNSKVKRVDDLTVNFSPQYVNL